MVLCLYINGLPPLNPWKGVCGRAVVRPLNVDGRTPLIKPVSSTDGTSVCPLSLPKYQLVRHTDAILAEAPTITETGNTKQIATQQLVQTNDHTKLQPPWANTLAPAYRQWRE